jgi:hypothetical protein
MRKQVAFLDLFAMSLILGCGPQGRPQAQDAQGLDPVPPAKLDKTAWKSELREAPKAGIRLQRLIMPKKKEDFRKLEARQTSLVQFPIDSRFNTQVFQIKGRSEWEYALFIGPRVMAFSSADGGRLGHTENTDGTATLTFPIALIDGVNETITAPAGAVQSIPIPQQFQVQDQKSLRDLARQRMGKIDSLAALPGCPRRIIIQVADRDNG